MQVNVDKSTARRFTSEKGSMRRGLGIRKLAFSFMNFTFFSF